jgi:hypothetical protein
MTQIRLLEEALAPVELVVIVRLSVGLLLGVKDDVAEDKVVVLDGPGLRILADLIALLEAADESIKVDDCPAVEESVNADD